jgi:hypothetical protein
VQAPVPVYVRLLAREGLEDVPASGTDDPRLTISQASRLGIALSLVLWALIGLGVLQLLE